MTLHLPFPFMTSCYKPLVAVHAILFLPAAGRMDIPSCKKYLAPAAFGAG